MDGTRAGWSTAAVQHPVEKLLALFRGDEGSAAQAVALVQSLADPELERALLAAIEPELKIDPDGVWHAGRTPASVLLACRVELARPYWAKLTDVRASQAMAARLGGAWPAAERIVIGDVDPFEYDPKTFGLSEDNLGQWQQVRLLRIMDCVVSVVARLGAVEQLELSNCGVVELPRSMPRLRMLSVLYARLSSLGGLETAPDLEEVRITGTHVDSLEPLRGASKLKVLDIRNCKQIRSLEPIAHLESLEHLALDRTQFEFEDVPERLRRVANHQPFPPPQIRVPIMGG